MDTRRLSRDVGWLWAGYFGRAAGYFGLIVVFTRALGTGGFGTLSLFLAVTLGVSQVAGSWPFLAVPVLSAREGSIGAAFRPSLYVAAIATAASLLLAIPLSLALGLDSPVTLLAVVASSVAVVGLQGVFSVQQTEGRMAEIAALQTSERILALVLALAVVAFSELAPVGAEVIMTIASVTVCAAAFAVVGRRQALFRRDPATHPDHVISTVMGAVGAMGIVSVCSYGVAYADIFILAAFKSNVEVGIYSLAYQVFSFVAMLTYYWMVAALPGHAKSSASGQSLVEQLPMHRLAPFAGLWAALVGAAGVASVLLIPLAFGPSFEGTLPPLLILLGGSGVLSALYFALLTALVGGGRSSLLAKVALGSVLINISLDVILVPLIGVTGPAVATFGQSIFGAAALSLTVLGLGSTLALLAVCAPAAVATAFLAINPKGPALIALCAVVAIATGVWSLRAARRGVAPAD